MYALRQGRFLATQASQVSRFYSARYMSTIYDKYKDTFERFGIAKSGNKGVFDGEWKGSGPVIKSVNPVNNEVIAEVISVSSVWLKIVEKCIFTRKGKDWRNKYKN